jgi:molybdenum cofactor biosynthesis enzyme MoaA
MEESAMFKIDMETLEQEIYNPVTENEKYKKAAAEYQAALKTGDTVKIDNAVIDIEVVTTDLVYQKAFKDGIKFIVDVIAGKEVFEI